MYTQVIQSVFFWAGLVVVGAWLTVELLNAWDHYRIHSAARTRLGHARGDGRPRVHG